VKRFSFSSFTIAALALLLFSCATIIHGSKQNVLVNSDPQGARIFLNGTDTKKITPAKISIKRKPGFQNIRLERAGFEDKAITMDSRFNFLVVVDFFLYLIPGFIDLSVGAHHLYDDMIYAPLNPLTIPIKETPVINSPAVYTFNKLSDVDVGFRETRKTNVNRYALIIGNEDYTSFQRDLSSEVNVLFARDDASAFNEYAQKLLGIPERNITLLLDATSAEMRQGLARMNMIAKNSDGQAEFYVFYAGHGLPDEATKEPYLMPVDVSGRYVKLGVSMKEFYAQLTEFPTERITVFIDACFSGGARNQGLIASRGVKITPKNESVKGNMIVFTASDADESALPYIKKNHGLFTYHLLQKLKDTEGALTYKELADYMEQKVALESVIINNKEQHPKTILSPDVVEHWQSWAFR
jgi:Caspase domain/PEGA domain